MKKPRSINILIDGKRIKLSPFSLSFSELGRTQYWLSRSIEWKEQEWWKTSDKEYKKPKKVEKK